MNVKKISYCFAFIAFSQIFGFINVPNFIYPIFLIVLFIRFVIFTRISLSNISLFLFLLVSILGLLFNDIPEYFKAWYRFFYFVILLSLVSPIIENKSLQLFRVYSLYFCSLAFVLISVLSFFCFFAGINFMKVQYEQDLIRSGTFSGLLNHSMMLGPVSALSSLFAFMIVLYHSQKKVRFVFFISMFLSVGSVFLAASRSAIIALIISSVFMLFLKYKQKKMKFFKYLLVSFFLLGTTFPLWRSLTDFVAEKQKKNVESGSMFNSREKKWEARLSEFNSSPIWGIGFACVNPEMDKVDKDSGIIEPGSSWLAVLSMTGLFGFCCVFYVFIYCIIRILKYQGGNTNIVNFLGGAIVFFFIHLMGEGYLLAAGSFLSFYCWLIVGCCFVFLFKKYENLNLYFLNSI